MSPFLKKYDIIFLDRGTKMKNSEKIILKMKENNGVITYNDIKKMKIDKKVIVRLLDNKQIERIEKGIYILPDSIGDEYFNKIYGHAREKQQIIKKIFFKTVDKPLFLY